MEYGFEEGVRLLDMVVGILVDAEHMGQRCSAVVHLQLVVQSYANRPKIVQYLPGV